MDFAWNRRKILVSSKRLIREMIPELAWRPMAYLLEHRGGREVFSVT